jgi:hypothetical protein
MPSRHASPRFVISSRSSPLLHLDRLADAAIRAATDGVEIDLTGGILRRRLFMRGWPLDVSHVLSLWLPASIRSLDDSTWSDWRPQRGLVVVDEESGHTPNGKNQLAAAIRLRERLGGSARVALAIRPRNPDGGRAHLARLSMLRNVAEEWDLDLALDMCGPVDWLWEAEAAILRLAPRLRLLRIAHPLPALDSHVRSRMTQRTIAAAVDGGFDGVVAVVVPLPIWRWHDASCLQRSSSVAVARLSDRFGIAPARYGQGVRQRSSAP